MLILSTSQRRDRGGRDCRTVSRVFHRPRNPKEPRTEAEQGLPRPQILARVLRNPIEHTTRQEEIKEHRLCFPLYYKKSFHFFPLSSREGRKKNFFSSTNEQAPKNLTSCEGKREFWTIINDGPKLSFALTLNDLLHDILIHVL